MDKPSIFSKRRFKRKSLFRRLWLPAVLILPSSIFLLVTAMGFQQRLEDLRMARTDNRGWIVSQLEVDYLELVIALDAATLALTGPGATPLDPAIERRVRQEFDVFYSRVTVFLSAMRRLQVSGAMTELLTQLEMMRAALALKIDGYPQLTVPDVASFLALVTEVRPLVRDVTVTAVQEISNEEARVAREEARLFARFFIQTILLFVLLAYGSFLVSRLWRQLDARTYDASRTAAVLSSAFDATLNAVVVIGETGRLMYFNAIAADIFALQPDHLQRADAAAMIRFVGQPAPPAPAADIAPLAPATLSGQGTQSGFCLRADGTALPVELSVVADTDVSGERIYIFFVRDISDRVGAEQKLRAALHEAEKAAQAKSMFLATMSHEMRTPLHGLMAALALVDDATLDPKTRALITTARGCSARAQMQVDDVLELTRLGDSVEKQRAFPVLKIVSDIIAELRPLANAAGNQISLVTEGPFARYALQGQPVAFSRVMYNLTGNALKFTTAGLVTIRLTLAEQAGGALALTVAVEDTGIGIAKEDQARIFENFETVDRSDTSAVTGSGLGLPIAKLAVAQQGGTLQVSSLQNVGSRFYFTIPVQVAHAAVPAMAGDDPRLPQAGGKHVLVVDDNDVNLTLMAEMVRRMGHSCVLASDGYEALTKAQVSRYDTILMDFSMPVMDGPTAAVRIRRDGGASAAAAIIGVTALIAPDLTQDQLGAFDAVLTKPVGLTELQQAIATVGHAGAALPPATAHQAAELPDAADDDPADPATAYADICAMVGQEAAQRLVLGSLQDGARALAAFGDPALDLVAKADLIHKAVGSTALMGMTDLSEILSESERQCRDGHDPRQMRLDVAAARALAETRAIYADLGLIVPA